MALRNREVNATHRENTHFKGTFMNRFSTNFCAVIALVHLKKYRALNRLLWANLTHKNDYFLCINVKIVLIFLVPTKHIYKVSLFSLYFENTFANM